jgi:hypothetical protein
MLELEALGQRGQINSESLTVRKAVYPRSTIANVKQVEKKIPMTGYYTNEAEIESVVQGFESCMTAKDDFSHASHLTVAVFYLYELGEPQATEKMRAGLLRFLNHHGIGPSKFHETLTVFWIKLVRAFLLQLQPQTSLVAMTNAVIERARSSRLVFEYYSEELLKSDGARKSWIEPDLKDLTGH